MKKFAIIIGCLIFLIPILLFLYNPPLDISPGIGYGKDNETILIPIGNKGITDIKNLEVNINGEEEPDDVKIQIIQHPDQAFSITLDVEDPSIFSEVEEVSLPKGTAVKENFEKNRIAYAVTVVSKEPVDSLTINYRYLGVSYREILDMY